ncbi:hypothetical protein BCEP4_790004 [Burkholderia cepacia]|nr:hypothetical protein BCEP4_790004 [Burkholderia cepacia]
MTGTFAGQAGHQTSIHRLNDSIALSHGPAEFTVDAGRRLRANARRPMPDARCPMPDARCPMPDARCPSWTGSHRQTRASNAGLGRSSGPPVVE